MISIGLKAVAQQVFNVNNGARNSTSGVSRVLVVLTDGQSQYQFGPTVINDVVGCWLSILNLFV
jgi:hypothetical protein